MRHPAMLFTLLLAPAAANAQAQPAGTAQPVAPIQVAGTPQPCPDSANVLYRQGVDLFAANRYAEAQAMFRSTLDVCPTHPNAGQMMQMAANQAAGAPQNAQPGVQPGLQPGVQQGVQPGMQPGMQPGVQQGSPVYAQPGSTVYVQQGVAPPPPQQLGVTVPVIPTRRYDDPVDSARYEIIVGQTIHGLFLGAMLGVAGQWSGPVATSTSFLGGAIGFTGSLLATINGVSPWRAQAISTGTVFGLWEGAMLAVTIGASGSFTGIPAPLVAGIMMGGGLVGLGAGLAGSYIFRPNEGGITAGTSGALWSTAITLNMAAALTNGDLFRTQAGLITFGVAGMIAPIAGFTGFSILGSQMQFSRKRGFLVDLAGAGGWTVGAAIAGGFAFAAPNEAPAIVGIGSTIGILAGLGIGILLTRDVDPQTMPAAPAMSFVPVGPHGPGMTLGFTM